MPLRMGAYAVLAALLLGLGLYAATANHRLAVRDASIATLQTQLETLKGSNTKLAREVTKRAKEDTTIRKSRTEVATKLDEVQREKDSPAADWLNDVIPDRVRDAYRASNPKR